MEPLYQLTQDMLQLLDLASDPDVPEDVLADTMEGLEGEFEIKCENCAKVMKQLEAEAAVVDAEVKRLTARKKALENGAKRLKKNVEASMIATGKKKFKTELFSFGIQKNPPSLRLKEDLDTDEVPAQFLKFEAPTVDKKAILQAIKEGAEFDFAEVVQTEGIRIR